MRKAGFKEYRTQLLELLLEQWRPARRRRELRAVVRFGLRRDGTVAFAEVRRSSGDAEYDAQAVEMVERGVRFPALPEAVSERAIFAFNFDADDGGPELQGAGVPRRPLTPERESGVELEEPGGESGDES